MRFRPAALALAGAALVATVAPATAADAAKPAAKPDTSCMHAGIKTLQSAGLLDDVARSGLPISTAVSLGVTVRPGADLAGVPDPLPLSLILADHRAGGSSLFVYPWCAS
jgi:hypothetical protein